MAVVVKSPDTLTRLQKKLLAEVREIVELARLDHENILAYEADARSARLRLMKDQVIRSQVIADYTFLDEMLGAAICHYFFGKKRGFKKLWKTKKFKTFNHYVLEVLSLSEKLRLVKAITRVPKSIVADIEALNALRNGLAHAFFPENLRSSKPIYKGQNIFTVEGFRRFIRDMGKTFDFLIDYNFGVRSSSSYEGDQDRALSSAEGPST